MHSIGSTIQTKAIPNVETKNKAYIVEHLQKFERKD